MALEYTEPQDVDLDRTDRLPIAAGTVFDEDVEDDAVRLDYAPAVLGIKSGFSRTAGTAPGADVADAAGPPGAIGAPQAPGSADPPEAAGTVGGFGAAGTPRDSPEPAGVAATSLAADGAKPAGVAGTPRAASAPEVAGGAGAARAGTAAAAVAVAIGPPKTAATAHAGSDPRDGLAPGEAPAIARAADSAPGAGFARLRALLHLEQERARALERALAAKDAAAEAARGQAEEALREAEQRHQSESRTWRETLAARDASLGQVARSLAERDAQLNALQREHAQVVPALEQRSRRGTQLEAELQALHARYEAMSGDLRNTRQASAALAAKLAAGAEELDSARRELHHARLQATTYLEHLRTREWWRGFAFTQHARGDVAALQAECDRLRARVIEAEAELAERDAAIGTLKAAGEGEQHGRENQSAAETASAELAAQVKRLQSEAQTREDENAVLLAHLREARRAVESPGENTDHIDLATKTRAIELLSEDNRALRAALEQARRTLEEREFLIRRLERGEGGAIDRMPMECTAELVRIDGEHTVSHTLARRTRIGRAPGCELHIASTSVSRHHAQLHVNSRDVIIEDLKSTNGVLVNGRRISRQLLNDGDLLTIGEAQFRLTIKPAPPEPAQRTQP
ncbi:MAG: FHA domain-containing protein [Pseudomonadota bacterium]|nr:FHA domain-containing protein [Pseudomonadota bacterium]